MNLIDVVDQKEVFNIDTQRPLAVEFHFDQPSGYPVPHLKTLRLTKSRDDHWWKASFHCPGVDFAVGEPASLGFDQDKVLTYKGRWMCNFGPLFENMHALANSLYIGAFRTPFGQSSGTHYGMQLGESFISTISEWKSGPTRERNERIQQITQDVKELFGARQLEINPSHDKKSLQLTVDGRSFKLHELGSGLAQAIMLLATTAINEPYYLFLDEPELSLHPSLQLRLMRSLNHYVKRGIVFASHSYGLVRTVADRIYISKRDATGIELEDIHSSTNLSDVLRELSFTAFRDGGYDAVLLVEGRNDVKAFAELLRKLDLDHRVVLIPIGGRELINKDCQHALEQLRKLSDKVFVVIDSEKKSAKAELSENRKAFVKVCDDLKISSFVIEEGAIENIFPDDAVKAGIGESAAALAPYRSDRQWGKGDNWKIAAKMDPKQLAESPLGMFLQTINS